MKNDWKHIKTIVDGDEFRVDGLNIWEHDWERTGQKITIKDPLYGQDYSMDVYEIRNAESKVTFAAGELSNCIWGIYMEK